MTDRLTQAAIAEHLDVSERHLRELLDEFGLDHRTASLDAIRVRYIRRLREQAAGRAAAGDLDLATERALLARSQREKIDLQNATTRKELMPTFLLEEVLSRAAQRACPLLATIPGELRRRVAGLSAESLAVVEEIVARSRNAIAATRLEDLLSGDEGDRADDDANDAEPPEVAVA